MRWSSYLVKVEAWIRAITKSSKPLQAPKIPISVESAMSVSPSTNERSYPVKIPRTHGILLVLKHRRIPFSVGQPCRQQILAALSSMRLLWARDRSNPWQYPKSSWSYRTSNKHHEESAQRLDCPQCSHTSSKENHVSGGPTFLPMCIPGSSSSPHRW